MEFPLPVKAWRSAVQGWWDLGSFSPCPVPCGSLSQDHLLSAAGRNQRRGVHTWPLLETPCEAHPSPTSTHEANLAPGHDRDCQELFSPGFRYSGRRKNGGKGTTNGLSQWGHVRGPTRATKTEILKQTQGEYTPVYWLRLNTHF